ncbi:MAG TPA: histidine ammonia-lyase [Longilinea sp.]|nr:histidine ammonia-lyase [Longilinea sp.]
MIEIDGHHLTLEQLVRVARDYETTEISEVGKQNIAQSRRWLEAILATDRPVYGINTGFGIFSDRRIPSQDSSQLSRNLILSHAVGTGEPLPEEVVRAAMLVRANTLTKGHSGVCLEVVTTLLDMLNKGVTPVIPSQGSLGSSGDLGPLSHMALVFTTDKVDRDDESGWATYHGERISGKEAMRRAGIQRIILGPKEGLAVNNGATFSAAIGALAVWDAGYICEIAEKALSLSLEAMLGCTSAFDARLHAARGQHGQVRVAQKVRDLTLGSTLIGSTNRVQDAYSLRCAPQVQGASLDAIGFVRGVIEAEINAATDNPLLFDPGEAISGGNFHGEPVGMAMDFLTIALAEIAAISERRVFRMTDAKLNENLPPMLVDSLEDAGLNSGLMMPQYTAASLVLENQTLAHPDSVHSLPTSGEQEDHNANAMTAARHARMVVENTNHVLAIELYTAARAVDLRLRGNPRAHLGQGTQKIYNSVRKEVPYQPGDAWWGPEIEKVKQLVLNRKLV